MLYIYMHIMYGINNVLYIVNFVLLLLLLYWGMYIYIYIFA